MARYCCCGVCVTSAPMPSAGLVVGPIERIEGQRVRMGEDWTLAHWSRKNFTEMQSREIHNFVQQQHRLRVGVSFFLYHGEPPTAAPTALSPYGLGGGYRYIINSEIGNELPVYYKQEAQHGVPLEVAIELGCGGTIIFDEERNATGHNLYPNVTPTIPIR